MPLTARTQISPYNFVDLETKATDYLARVRGEALGMMTQVRDEIHKLRKQAELELASVRAEAEGTRAATLSLNERLANETQTLETMRNKVETEAHANGYKEGYATGYAEGKQQGYIDGELQAQIDYADKVRTEAELQLAAKLETLIPAIQMMITKLGEAQHGFLGEWEKSAIHVATEIAHRAINRQLPEMIDLPLDMVREALELGVGSGQLKIRMNPLDHETLLPQVETLVREVAHIASCEIVADPKVSAGGCVMETSLGSVDQRIESRLHRIECELV
ncbi:MAG: FliH/SctL family protein [Thermoguttaceae bacterium]